MDDANGTLKPQRATPGINGVVKSQLNGHPVGPKRGTKPKGPGVLARTLSIVAR